MPSLTPMTNSRSKTASGSGDPCWARSLGCGKTISSTVMPAGGVTDSVIGMSVGSRGLLAFA
jgi:hypothetical protein